jgi:hypothetical protein
MIDERLWRAFIMRGVIPRLVPGSRVTLRLLPLAQHLTALALNAQPDLTPLFFNLSENLASTK